jgi:epoxyqueuosine reductase QueG
MKAANLSREYGQTHLSQQMINGLEMKDLITEFLLARGIDLFGFADLRSVGSLADEAGQSFPRAVSYAVPMDAEIMAGIKRGPNRQYAEEYARVNRKIDSLSQAMAEILMAKGCSSKALPASARTDTVHMRGDFPHKTAATRAGLGWIGRNCQLITKTHGPWVRLGTVFIDLPIEIDRPIRKSLCGECRECVEACPAGALVGNLWTPGIPREKLLDVRRCDEWKKKHYPHFHQGHNCGICAAVCPFGK